MIVDKKYSMSSFLMYRRIVDSQKQFKAGIIPNIPDMKFERTGVSNSTELMADLKKQVEAATKDGKAAIALSGGIDSAILAKFMPKGSTAYTFKCVVPGVKVTDETEAAAKYAKECGLKHKVVEVYWEDFEKFAPLLMNHKGAPIHSIEVQVYKAALQAKADGFERLIYGESSDCIFGGLSNLLSKDWLIGDFIERYEFVKPYKVLKESELVLDPIQRHERDGHVDPHEFLSTEFLPESLGSYVNASETANFGVVIPFSRCYLEGDLDYQRIRNGENKYLVREIFNYLFKGFNVPEKRPMPRATNEWLKDWAGPKRPEFYPHCTDDMSGDQKWLVMALEMFLNQIED
ncbi:asparagine synthase [Lactobacillus sp. CBA3605]|uniref:asparagine synthase C-terminal domain-containing protein n=1 Tax=Lactobacillus sp. CBA3605 TaxID=2099788 RepID=UPI000CFB77A1|nr:asparagine synthase C-terminal domain-containing protein [Lactobacillus sp. CBA3605]AVK60721.1 asparagine synthase [Lactobacillus sp. CBA3605]